MGVQTSAYLVLTCRERKRGRRWQIKWGFHVPQISELH